MTLERRILSSHLTVRATGGVQKLVGHAAVFHRDSELIGGAFIERIAPGAFADSIAADDVRALFNHDANFILGRTTSKTLRLREDEHGLAVEIDPPKTSYAADLMESTKRGDITQMSFGFQTIADKWERGQNGAHDVRTLLKVRLFDVSPVTFPAYVDTDVAVRSHQQFLGYPSNETGGHFSQEVATRRRRLQLFEIEDSYWPVPGGGSSGSTALDVRRRRLDLEQLVAGA